VVVINRFRAGVEARIERLWEGVCEHPFPIRGKSAAGPFVTLRSVEKHFQERTAETADLSTALRPFLEMLFLQSEVVEAVPFTHPHSP
jgi:hypothetical protein